MNTGSGWSTNAKILQLAICLDYLRFNCVKSWEGVALSYQIGQCNVTDEANIRWPLSLSDMRMRFRRYFPVTWYIFKQEKPWITGENVAAFSEVHVISSSPFPRLSLLHNPQTNMKPCHVTSPFCWTHALRYLGNLTLFILKRGN